MAPQPHQTPLQDVAFQGTLLAGLSLRAAALYLVPALSAGLSARPEVSTPAASWKRLQEGIYLFERGLDPYQGDMYQQSPLLLAFFSLVSIEDDIAVSILFAVADAIAAVLLWQIAAQRRRTTSESIKTRIKPWIAAAVFFLHPFSIASCLGRSPSIFATVLVLSSVLLASQGAGVRSAINLALAAHLSFYNVLLLPPLAMLASGRRSSSRWVRDFTFIVPRVLGTGWLCRWFLGSWSFLRAYQSLLSVNDLTPNVGLSWYLFIEMFDHFRNFFVGAFHLHVLSYVAPLCIKLPHAPLFVATVLEGIIATFRSYPSIADVALLHSLLALFPELLPHMRHPLFSASVLFYSTCLLPAFHHVWLYAGSGNANFYYASTLVWGIGNGALVGDALYAHLKRDFLLAETGKEELEKDAVVVQE